MVSTERIKIRKKTKINNNGEVANGFVPLTVI